MGPTFQSPREALKSDLKFDLPKSSPDGTLWSSMMPSSLFMDYPGPSDHPLCSPPDCDLATTKFAPRQSLALFTRFTGHSCRCMHPPRWHPGLKATPRRTPFYLSTFDQAIFSGPSGTEAQRVGVQTAWDTDEDDRRLLTTH